MIVYAHARQHELRRAFVDSPPAALMPGLWSRQVCSSTHTAWNCSAAWRRTLKLPLRASMMSTLCLVTLTLAGVFLRGA
jgi:hypothetical protein